MNDELAVFPAAVKADIAALSVFVKAEEDPLIRAFSALLDAAKDVLEPTSPLTAYKAARETVVQDAVLKLIGAWSGFTAELASSASADGGAWYDAVLSVTRRTVSHRDICDFKESAPHYCTHDNALLKNLVKTDIERFFRIASFDISAFAFAAADTARQVGFDDAATAIEGSARALWELEARSARAHTLETFAALAAEDGNSSEKTNPAI